jgi:hypothetical protein
MKIIDIADDTDDADIEQRAAEEVLSNGKYQYFLSLTYSRSAPC